MGCDLLQSAKVLKVPNEINMFNLFNNKDIACLFIFSQDWWAKAIKKLLDTIVIQYLQLYFKCQFIWLVVPNQSCGNEIQILISWTNFISLTIISLLFWLMMFVTKQSRTI